jgi:hypothetical protein
VAGGHDLLALQRLIGNQATCQLSQSHQSAHDVLQRRPGKSKTPKVDPGARVEKIGTESVQVSGDAELDEAKTIIKSIKSKYGISLSSPQTVKAIKAEYGDVSAKEIAKLRTGTWEMKELRAVDAALAHFAPILGSSRKKSTLATRSQGVTSLGRVKQAIDEDSATGVVEDGTMGEYFGSKKNVGFFDSVTDLADNRYHKPGPETADNATTLEANAVHEMSHGLIEPHYINTWVKKMGFWFDEDTPSGELTAEDPPTQYGQTSAGEDLAESVAIFFVNRAQLKAACPERETFLSQMVAGWTPQVKKAAVKSSVAAKGKKGK